MLQQSKDFLEECDVLAALLNSASDDVWAMTTQFKGWSIEDVIAHLHMWNVAAGATLASREEFQSFFAFVMSRMGAGDGHQALQRAWLDENLGGLRGRALFDAWRSYYPALAKEYGAADPEKRVAWAGPDMSVSAKIVARQMECWAHGQEVFDALGAARSEGDRIRNIAELGVRTYGWTFRNRGEEPPQPKPFVKLTAPSGAEWTWNEPQPDNIISGPAVAFSQVVTQTRNVGDTNLMTIGDTAARWMSIAQCFAGAPEDPPAKGERFRVSR